MKKTFLVLFAVVLTGASFAHPGIGIVCDSRGNIFYTDLKNIWKISPDGRKTIAVANVHSHELYLDKHDNLYGEHLWYNGERLNTWEHYVWCLRNNSVLDTAVPRSAAFNNDYSFVRDTAGNIYWAERFKTYRFKKRTLSGLTSTIAEGKFHEIGWMYCTADGIIYFIDLLDLYKLDKNGQITLIGSHLASISSSDDGRHSLYGIWTDKQDNVYVAILANNHIKKIAPDGTAKIILQSPEGWYPTSGVFDKKGNLWLMEGDHANNIRVRKITPDMLHQPAAIKSSLSFTLITEALLFAGIALVTSASFIKLFSRLREFALRQEGVYQKS